MVRNQPDQDAEGDFQNFVPHQQSSTYRKNADDGTAGEHPEANSSTGDGFDKLVARVNPYSRQKKNQANLPQNQVGTIRQRPVDGPAAAQTAQNQTHDDGATRKTQFKVDPSG